MSPSTDRAAVSRALPCALAFLASLSLMGVEVASGRMMAMYVGAGLYTWTSVIGVVLGGMTIGNLLGGRLADRFDPRRALCVLFAAASLACAALPVISYWVGREMMWEVPTVSSFPLRVAEHVAAVFLLPSTVLGLIGPAVAKLALDAGSATGRTVGNVYAWGAVGSIIGTFVTGFYLIDAIGTSGVVLGVAGVLAATAILLSPALSARMAVVTWPLATGLLVGALLVAGRGPGRLIWADGHVAVQERGLYNRIYSDESQYSFIRIEDDLKKSSRNVLMDNLSHAVYSPDKPKELQYGYELVYDILTERHGRSREDLRTLFIGGGGYIFPRHIRDRWPHSSIQVAEIDPAVTEANFQAFGLKRDEVVILESADAPRPPIPGAANGVFVPKPIEIFHLDARNHIEDLLRQKREGKGFEPFDFVYGDAFNDYCVPFHLVTQEFMEKVRDLLRPGAGIYLMNVIDIYDSSLFMGAMYNTLRKVFPHVAIFSSTPGGPAQNASGRDTYIIAASLRALDLADLGKRPGEEGFIGAILDQRQLDAIAAHSNGVVLTDDYAPVENLLDIVVRLRAAPASEN